MSPAWFPRSTARPRAASRASSSARTFVSWVSNWGAFLTNSLMEVTSVAEAWMTIPRSRATIAR